MITEFLGNGRYISGVIKITLTSTVYCVTADYGVELDLLFKMNRSHDAVKSVLSRCISMVGKKWNISNEEKQRGAEEHRLEVHCICH